MTDEQIALSHRAVACKGWRWMPGMRWLVGPLHAPYRYVTADCTPPEGNDVVFTAPFLPDLTDAATLGCFLALVREAWGCAVITSPDYDYDDEEARQGETVIGWRAVETVSWVTVGEGDTEAHALVAALEAAHAEGGEHRREEEKP